MPRLKEYSNSLYTMIPAQAPSRSPSAIETGMSSSPESFAPPPCAIVRKVENSTITNTSSHDAPASIICGMPFSVPRFFSIRDTMRGTTTAGDTALSTAPIKAESVSEVPRRKGANIRYPAISKQAGRKLISTAERPTFFRSERSSASPAFISIMMSAV